MGSKQPFCIDWGQYSNIPNMQRVIHWACIPPIMHVLKFEIQTFLNYQNNWIHELSIIIIKLYYNVHYKISLDDIIMDEGYDDWKILVIISLYHYTN